MSAMSLTIQYPILLILQCGGCWAYSATAAIEAKVLISLGKKYAEYPLDLSEQQLLDCANKQAGYESSGCNGGFITDPLRLAAR